MAERACARDYRENENGCRAIEGHLELLRRAPALLDHGQPFTRMPEWLKELREALGDDKSLVELLLAVDRGKYRLQELQKAARSAMLGRRSVMRAHIKQEALIGRSDAGEVEALGEQECGKLRFAIESPEMYDEIIALGEGSSRGQAAESCEAHLAKGVG